MSIKTTRACDHCGLHVKDDEELWTIGVVAICNPNVNMRFSQVFSMHSRTTQNNRLLKDHFMDMCRPCMTDRGLVVAPNEEPAQKPETLDSLLNEIVEEKMQDFMDGER